jgi:hypothetical protein
MPRLLLDRLAQQRDQTRDVDAEQHGAFVEGDRAVPGERAVLEDEHRSREQLRDDLPDRDVGHPRGKDVVLVEQDRDREDQVLRGEAAERADEREQGDVVEHRDLMWVTVRSERRGEKGDRAEQASGDAADGQRADVAVGEDRPH